MNNKKAFGLDTVDTEPAEAFDVVLVGPSVSLEDVARAAGVPESSVDALNPGYLSARTPPWCESLGGSKPSWRVRVPAGKGPLCTSALARISGDDDSFETYVSKFGDTVESIADTHGVSEARLRAINRVEPKEVLASGTVLLVPRTARAAAAEPNDEVLCVRAAALFRLTRSARGSSTEALPGDTLGRVANVFAVSTADIGLWNALDESARLQLGYGAATLHDKSKNFLGPYHSVFANSRSRRRNPRFLRLFRGPAYRKRVVVSARENDTLATLGKRYGMTVGSMERVNCRFAHRQAARKREHRRLRRSRPSRDPASRRPRDRFSGQRHTAAARACARRADHRIPRMRRRHRRTVLRWRCPLNRARPESRARGRFCATEFRVRIQTWNWCKERALGRSGSSIRRRAATPKAGMAAAGFSSPPEAAIWHFQRAYGSA